MGDNAMATKKALIVEDESDLSAVILSLIETFGFEGTVADTGQKAQNYIEKNQYHFVIIDLTLPDIDGVDLYKDMISHHPAYRGKVIFTSGFSISDALKEIMERDDVSFLSKPFTIDEFKELIMKWQ
jgi:DNA-binding NtrC family response regulator